MEERRGEAFELGEQLTVIGSQLEPGSPAPDFTLETIDPGTGAPAQVSLANSQGKVRILNVINSIDTPVCHTETHQWDKLRATLPDDIAIYTVSMDLPFALDRWNKAENVTVQGLSSHKNEKFAQDYGVLIKEWRMLQRAVFVIDRSGK